MGGRSAIPQHRFGSAAFHFGGSLPERFGVEQLAFRSQDEAPPNRQARSSPRRQRRFGFGDRVHGFEQKEIDCSLREYQSQLFMLAAGLVGRWRQVRPEAVFERRENSGAGGGAFAACLRARLAGGWHAGPPQARGGG